jgi:hypothetical protein
MTVLLTLTTAGADSGPLFNLYSNIDYVTPLQTGVTKSALQSGYTLSGVPDTATIIRITSTGTSCTNSIDVTVTGGSTTTTSSTTSTPTPNITISNNSNNLSVDINEVYVNGNPVTLDSPYSFPIGPNTIALGTYTFIPGNTAQTVQVFTNNAIDSPVTLTVYTPIVQTPCLLTTGDIVFTGLDLSTGPSINLDLGGEGEQCI